VTLLPDGGPSDTPTDVKTRKRRNKKGKVKGLRAFGATDRGRVRAVNEDCFGIEQQLQLCVVADGMGGHNAGEVAARIAVDTVTECVRGTLFAGDSPESSGRWPYGFEPSLSKGGNLLRTAIHMANAQVLEASGAVEEYSGMGTTIVAALFRDGRLSIAHVGDSRLYIYDRRGLRLVTADDSWMASVLAQDPQADRAMLMQHPMRNALTNVVGARAGTEVHVTEETLKGGEVVLLTTDGVHATLDDARIEELLNGGKNLEAVAANLIAAALESGSRDNCTAVVAKYVGG
jgi:protein phosphatase